MYSDLNIELLKMERLNNTICNMVKFNKIVSMESDTNLKTITLQSVLSESNVTVSNELRLTDISDAIYRGIKTAVITLIRIIKAVSKRFIEVISKIYSFIKNFIRNRDSKSRIKFAEKIKDKIIESDVHGKYIYNSKVVNLLIGNSYLNNLPIDTITPDTIFKTINSYETLMNVRNNNNISKLIKTLSKQIGSNYNKINNDVVENVYNTLYKYFISYNKIFNIDKGILPNDTIPILVVSDKIIYISYNNKLKTFKIDYKQIREDFDNTNIDKIELPEARTFYSLSTEFEALRQSLDDNLDMTNNKKLVSEVLDPIADNLNKMLRDIDKGSSLDPKNMEYIKSVQAMVNVLVKFETTIVTNTSNIAINIHKLLESMLKKYRSIINKK